MKWLILLVILGIIGCADSTPTDTSDDPNGSDSPTPVYDVAGVWTIHAVNDSTFLDANGGTSAKLAYTSPCTFGIIDSVWVNTNGTLDLQRSGSFEIQYNEWSECHNGFGGRIISSGSISSSGTYETHGALQDSIRFIYPEWSRPGIVLGGVASGEAGTAGYDIVPAYIRIELRRWNASEAWERFFSLTFRHGSISP